MYHLDAVVTQRLNGLAGAIPAIDLHMAWTSAIGVLVMVAATAAQWWAGTTEHTPGT
ncbi:MAG TPA: hypothetical protein VKA32_01135 [Gammaproteobacteria bacterium]|nr:hypothetical protein [Gammaproteobacteria bacterium]